MRAYSRAFTLLEVMVAIAILGLGLTSILSAQAGAFASAGHARNISVATGLLRCKMSEIEEDTMRKGFQELDVFESGICCEGDDTPNMRCSWAIEKPQLPEARLGELKLDAALTSGNPAAAIGLLTGGQSGPSASTGNKAGDVASMFANAAAPSTDPNATGGAGGIDAIAGMVMSLVYPSIKSIFEASTRRLTTTLTWREGAKEYSTSTTEWIANPQRAGVVGDDADADAGVAAPASTTTTKTTTTVVK